MASKGHRVSWWVLPVALALIAVGVGFVLVARPWGSQTVVDEDNATGPNTDPESREVQVTSNQTDVTQPSQTSYKTELAERFAKGEVRSVRLVGDSITAGFGTDGYEDANLIGQGNVIYDDGAGTVRYETSEQARCWANEFRSFATERGAMSFVNAGINGAFMVELAQNPDAWIMDGADVIVVALGTNDAGYYGPDEYRSASEEALAAASTRCQTLVVVSPVSDLRPEWMLVEPAGSLGDILRDICEERGYLFVDARDAVSPDQFCEDGLHPNTDGSLAIWSCLCDALGL